jgi:hypothetical protein
MAPSNYDQVQVNKLPETWRNARLTWQGSLVRLSEAIAESTKYMMKVSKVV